MDSMKYGSVVTWSEVLKIVVVLLVMLAVASCTRSVHDDGLCGRRFRRHVGKVMKLLTVQSYGAVHVLLFTLSNGLVHAQSVVRMTCL